jgi:gliding motility-associated-like protein
MIATDTGTCNKVDSTTFTIVVSPNPKSSFVYAPNPPITNTPVAFTNNSTGGILYKWYFGDGDSIITTLQTPPVSHTYNASKTFNACLLVSNSYNCIDTSCQTVVASIVPVLEIPTAFTPNGDGVNDMIHVKAFGVAKLEWRIYNRWGKVVFISYDKDYGWDGRYNGAVQPQDVYNYTIKAEFTDGSKVSRTGDITLLR